MKRIFKDTKFWMYIPFACIWGLKMSTWVFSANTEKDGQYRMMFIFFNLFETLLFIFYIFLKTYNVHT